MSSDDRFEAVPVEGILTALSLVMAAECALDDEVTPPTSPLAKDIIESPVLNHLNIALEAIASAVSEISEAGKFPLIADHEIPSSPQLTIPPKESTEFARRGILWAMEGPTKPSSIPEVPRVVIAIDSKTSTHVADALALRVEKAARLSACVEALGSGKNHQDCLYGSDALILLERVYESRRRDGEAHKELLSTALRSGMPVLHLKIPAPPHSFPPPSTRAEFALGATTRLLARTLATQWVNSFERVAYARKALREDWRAVLPYLESQWNGPGYRSPDPLKLLRPRDEAVLLGHGTSFAGMLRTWADRCGAEKPASSRRVASASLRNLATAAVRHQWTSLEIVQLIVGYLDEVVPSCDMADEWCVNPISPGQWVGLREKEFDPAAHLESYVLNGAGRWRSQGNQKGDRNERAMNIAKTLYL